MPKLLVIDTETGGLDPQIHSILTLGAVVWEDGRITDEIELLIAEPEIVAGPVALEMNKIDLAKHKRVARPPAEAMALFWAFLTRHFSDSSRKERIQLAGHNIYFDIGFLQRFFRLRLATADYERTFSHRVLDTAAVLRFLILAKKLPLSEAGLSEACKFFRIKFPPHKRHTAKEDARATAKLLTKLIEVASTP